MLHRGQCQRLPKFYLGQPNSANNSQEIWKFCIGLARVAVPFLGVLFAELNAMLSFPAPWQKVNLSACIFELFIAFCCDFIRFAVIFYSQAVFYTFSILPYRSWCLIGLFLQKQGYFGFKSVHHQAIQQSACVKFVQSIYSKTKCY